MLHCGMNCSMNPARAGPTAKPAAMTVGKRGAARCQAPGITGTVRRPKDFLTDLLTLEETSISWPGAEHKKLTWPHIDRCAGRPLPPIGLQLATCRARRSR